MEQGFRPAAFTPAYSLSAFQAYGAEYMMMGAMGIDGSNGSDGEKGGEGGKNQELGDRN